MDVEMRQGDAITFLKSLDAESVDLVITDPAYESLEKWRNQGTTTRLKNSKASSNSWFPVVPNSYFDEFFRECYRVLKKSRYLFVFCDDETSDVVKPDIVSAGFTWRKRLVWAKHTTNPQPRCCPACDAKMRCQSCGTEYKEHNQFTGMGYPFRASYEFVLFAQKGKRQPPENRSMLDVFQDPAIKSSDAYPTEKPVSLAEKLILQSTEPGDLVVDPFAGSGFALKAAAKLGRRGLGNDYLQTTVDRFNTWKAQATGDSAHASPSEEVLSEPEEVNVLDLF